MERNLQPIAETLSPFLTRSSTQCVLELASGCGQHLCSWATAHPTVHFQPTDRDPESVKGTRQRIQEGAFHNIAQPRMLDVLDEAHWTQMATLRPKYDMLVSINLIHVSPWYVLSLNSMWARVGL